MGLSSFASKPVEEVVAANPQTFFQLYWAGSREQQWDGPMMLKGVMRVDDARQAVEAGFDAISVSNHGGNNLDGTPASRARCTRARICSRVPAQ